MRPLHRVIGDAISGGLKDPRIGFLTVTDVRTSPDLRHARVYVSVLGSHGEPAPEAERDSTLEGLRSAHGYLQGRVASELHLKRTPDARVRLRRHHRPCLPGRAAARGGPSEHERRAKTHG